MKDVERPGLGAILKRLRQERGTNLSQLAKASGLPQSTLSKVENGQMSLNYDKLILVAEALGVDIARLFQAGDGSDAPMSRRTIDRRSSEGFGRDDHYRFQHLSTELKNRLMAPLLLEVVGPERPAGRAEDVPMMNLVGERFAYVLDGPVDFLCAHYETVTLESGDSLYVDAAMPHAFVCAPGRTARVLTVLSSTDADYLQLVREAATRGASDASGRYMAMHARPRSEGRAD